jgi:hypothetical protein
VSELQTYDAPLSGQIVDRDAIEIGEFYEAARNSIIDSVRHAAEAGRRLAEKKASLKHGEWLPWLEANAEVLGFGSDRTAQRLIGLANPTLTSDLDIISCKEAVNISRKLWGNEKGAGQLIQQSLSNEHYTPVEYINAARRVLGGIDLDPATCLPANETVLAEKIFTQADDGLRQPWNGRVWLNPPYGRFVGEFISKLMAEIAAQRVAAAITLVNAHCTDTSWFQPLWNGTLCFTHHRINFYGDDSRSGSTHGSVFAYFGDQIDLFADEFRQFGAVVRELRP